MKDWFKNVFSYRIKDDSKVYTESEIAALIEDHKIGEFGAGQLETSGFGKVFGEKYFFPINDKCFLFSFQVDKKDIPKKIVDKMVKDINTQYIAENGVSMSRNELIICREEVVERLLPNAFTKSSNIMGYINYQDMTMVVDASSPSKFDLFSSNLRNMLVDLKTEIINPDIDVSKHMGGWLNDYSIYPNNSSIEVDSSFLIGDACVMKQASDDDMATIALTNKDLDDNDVRNHLDNGAIVESLAIDWDEKLRFTLNANFRVTKVKSSDLVSDIVDDYMGDYDMKTLDQDETLLMEYNRVSYGVMIEYFSDLQKDLLNLFAN